MLNPVAVPKSKIIKKNLFKKWGQTKKIPTEAWDPSKINKLTKHVRSTPSWIFFYNRELQHVRHVYKKQTKRTAIKPKHQPNTVFVQILETFNTLIFFFNYPAHLISDWLNFGALTTIKSIVSWHVRFCGTVLVVTFFLAQKEGDALMESVKAAFLNKTFKSLN
jgi:hypothetical protein